MQIGCRLASLYAIEAHTGGVDLFVLQDKIEVLINNWSSPVSQCPVHHRTCDGTDSHRDA